jgi:hypothetical protein
MYDPLTSRYTFACPCHGESRVSLSAFRTLERLEGTAHPVVYRIRFACRCGDEHDGLVTHDELDWAPLGLDGGVFLNLMTAKLEPSRPSSAIVRCAHQGGGVAVELLLLPGGAAAPGFPSSFFLLTPGDGTLGLAVRCPACQRTSVNLVSQEHVDVPFHNDREIGVVEHVFPDDAHATVEEFRAELWSATFDARRLALE